MLPEHNPKTILIGLVGPCISGKTTISNLLKQRGYHAKVIAQEHSYVPAMWQIITKPQYLVYLHVSFPIAQERRKMNWSIRDYEEQIRRLEHARTHADVIIDTDTLTPDEVMTTIIGSLSS